MTLAVVLATAVLATGPALAPAARGSAAGSGVTAAPEAARSRWSGPSAPVLRVGGWAYVSTTDLSRLLGATRFWRADTRKLVLGIRDLRITLTVDNPFVVVGTRTWRLEAPVRSLDGDVHAPIGLLALLPPAADGTALVWDEPAGRVRRPVAAGPGRLRVSLEGGVTRVLVPTARAASWRWIDRSRAVLRLQIPGARATAPDSLPEGALVRAVISEQAGAEPVLALALSGPAAWVRVTADTAARRVVVEVSGDELAGGVRLDDEAGGRSLALRTIVLDPGHGGADPGVRSGERAEKDVVLALSRVLAAELERRTGARVRLTREGDEALAQERRAEVANRERADVVLSLHVDGFRGPRARGATVWVPPAAAGPATDALPAWREVASRHARESRALASEIARTFEARGLGPVRVRERMPIGLHGVDAPGVVLECATLTSPEDRARLEGAGLRDLARAIADAVARWSRS